MRAVNMVYTRLVFWVRNECLCYEYMNILTPRASIVVKKNISVNVLKIFTGYIYAWL